MGNSLKRGSVVLAIYPFTDLSSAKRRPALAVLATGRPGRDCILAFITSRTSHIEATDLMLDPTVWFNELSLMPERVLRGLRAG